MSRSLFTKTSWNNGAAKYHDVAKTYSARAIFGENLEIRPISWPPYYLHENSGLAKVLLQARHTNRN
jgi:hypothetical protein